MKKAALCAAWCAALSFAAPALAAPSAPPRLRDATSVRAAGMAGAARGFASSNEALLVNPAGIASIVRFNLDASGFFGLSGEHQQYSVTAVDSQLNSAEALQLSGGFGYHYYASGEGADERSGSLIASAFAIPLAESLFFGTTFKYLRLDGAVKANAVTLDTGLMLKPVPFLGLSAVGYNLVDIRNPEARRSWGFGAAVGDDSSFHLDFDLRLEPDAQDQSVISWFAGGEVVIAKLFLPRAGFGYDRLRDVREVTVGFSFLAALFAFEVAYRHDLRGDGQTLGIALRSLAIPF